MRYVPTMLALLLASRASAGVMPLAPNAAEAAQLRGEALGAARVFASDLLSSEKGRLLEINSRDELPAGLYRVHVPLAVYPAGDPRIEDIAVTVTLDGAKHAVDMARCDGSGVPTAWPFDVAKRRAGRLAATVAWELGPRARAYRLKHLETPCAAGVPGHDPDAAVEAGELPGDEAGLEALLDEPDRDGTVEAAHAARMACRLVGYEPVIERLPALAIGDVQTSKILYVPGEAGVITVNVRNHGKQPLTGSVSVVLAHALADTAPVAQEQVSVEGQAEATVTVPFEVGGRWGYELRASVTSPEGTHTKSTWFTVSDDPWEVGIGHAEPLMTGRHAQLDLVPKLRGKYSNWIDLFFWAPCDWAKLTSPLDEWWSGQADYHHVEKHLQALIAACHTNGVRVAFYASRNPAGPFAWDVARRHPEWFGRNAFGGFAGHYNVEHLEKWNDTEWRNVVGKRMGETDWYAVGLNLRDPEPVDYGIDQIIESIDRYGWDMIRFDGHYTVTGNDALSTRHMRRLKERVWAKHPRFLFGFNYGRAPEWRTGVTHEMREAMAGGGLYMQEGIRNWRYTDRAYASWTRYATNELRVAKAVQAMGGTYHCIWSMGQDHSPAQQLYKLVYGLIAGGHPCYGTHDVVPGSTGWGAFMTRWCGMLWDRNLESMSDPDRLFDVDAAGLQWEPFVQSRVVSGRRRFVVLHLVNPPPNDAIAAAALPEPLGGGIGVTFRPPAGERVHAVLLARPDAQPFDEMLWEVGEGGARSEPLTVVVPGVRHWAMVVWELEGTYAVPSGPARFTEQPDPLRVSAGIQRNAAAGGVIAADPNKPSADTVLDPTAQVWETDSGFSGHGIRTIADDPDATGGLAQMRDLGENGGTYPFMGRPYLGPVPAGRHRAVFRIKHEMGEAPGHLRLFMRVHHDQEDRDLVTAHLRSVDYPEQTSGKSVVVDAAPGYHDYALEFELRSSALVSCDTWPAGPQGDCKVYLDHVRLEAIERYSDRHVETWTKVEVPEGLREPRGGHPQRCLFVKGLFWQTYVGGESTGGGPDDSAIAELLGLASDSAYALPVDHDGLHKFDTLVLCNVDVSSRPYRERRLVRDWTAAGGRLVILGGSETLGQGGMVGTYLEEMLPFVLKGAGEVARCEPPAELRSLGARSAVDRGVVFLRHDIEPKEGVETLAAAGPRPIAARHRFGGGTVCVFAGTVLGDGAGEPFWETATWRDLLRAMVLK